MEETMSIYHNLTTHVTLTEFVTSDGSYGNVTNNILNQTNTTVSTSGRNKELDALIKKIFDISVYVTVCITMCALGCTIELKTVKQQFRRPFGIVIGFVCQFIVFPALTFGLAHLLKLEKWIAIGMILLGTSPGGSVSNVLTLYCQGDVTLSVTMTAISTLAALGMIPLNTWIYSRSWGDNKMLIPYENILIGLAMMLIPAAVGVVILRNWPRVAKWILRAGNVVGLLLLGMLLGITSYLYPQIYTSSWRIWLASVLLPVIGLIIGYLTGSIFCLSHAQRRAIAIEVACQNVALCLTLISLTYKGVQMFEAMVFPQLFFICGTTIICVLIAVYHIQRLIRKRLGLLDEKKKKTQSGGDKGEENKKVDGYEIQVAKL